MTNAKKDNLQALLETLIASSQSRLFACRDEVRFAEGRAREAREDLRRAEEQHVEALAAFEALKAAIA